MKIMLLFFITSCIIFFNSIIACKECHEDKIITTENEHYNDIVYHDKIIYKNFIVDDEVECYVNRINNDLDEYILDELELELLEVYKNEQISTECVKNSGKIVSVSKLDRCTKIYVDKIENYTITLLLSESDYEIIDEIEKRKVFNSKNDLGDIELSFQHYEYDNNLKKYVVYFSPNNNFKFLFNDTYLKIHFNTLKYNNVAVVKKKSIKRILDDNQIIIEIRNGDKYEEIILSYIDIIDEYFVLENDDYIYKEVKVYE